MFGVVNPTGFDLDFRLFGIPVRVSGWFWLAGAFLGFGSLKMGLPYLLAWLLVLFVSILVHELGHALTARYFGHSTQILLYHFGGLAFRQAGPRSSSSLWQSILISLAGPMAGFALFGLVQLFQGFGLRYVAPDMNPEFLKLLVFVIIQLNFINLYWGLINLLPVLPLDGGQICRDLCLIVNRRNGLWLAVRIGAVVGAGASIGMFLMGNTFAGILFAMLTINNVQALQQEGRGW